MTASPADAGSTGAGDPERRAPVQSDSRHPDGSVAWWEHELAWQNYHRRYATQDAETIAKRAGFSYTELALHLGHPPATWRPGVTRYTPCAVPSPEDTVEPDAVYGETHWLPADACREDGCHHGADEHRGGTGRCMSGKGQKGWRCDCRAFVSPTPPAARTGEDDEADVKMVKVNVRPNARSPQWVSVPVAALSARPLVSGAANRDDVARLRAQAAHLLNGGRFEDEWSEAATLIRELLALLGGDQDNEDGAR